MIAQAGIALFGLWAVWLTQDPRPERRRWSCIAGLISQPFWFAATWDAGQWGIFALSVAYTFVWARGFWNFWIKRRAA